MVRSAAGGQLSYYVYDGQHSSLELRSVLVIIGLQCELALSKTGNARNALPNTQQSSQVGIH